MSLPSVRSLRFAALACATVAAGLVMASYDGMFNTVHFYSLDWSSEDHPYKVDFGRVPQITKVPGWTNEIRRGFEAIGSWPSDAYSDTWSPNGDDCNCIARARNLEARGLYQACLRDYRRGSADESFVRDRADLFKEVGFRNVKGLTGYLRDTYLIANGDSSQQAAAIKGLGDLPCDPRLEPHRAYVLASAGHYNEGADAARRYLAVYQRFPHTSRAEPAVIMAARCLLHGNDRKISVSDVELARDDVGLLLDRFPHTRFRESAEGWLIRCDWLEGHEAKAASEYLHRAEHGTTPSVRWMGYESIEQLCRTNHQWAKEIRFLLLQRRIPDTIEHQTWTGKELRKRFVEISPSDAELLQKEIRSDPRLLESYIAFRIEDTSLDRRQEVSLLRFAVASIEGMRSPTPALLERVAQIAYNNGSYRTARRYALGSLSRGAEGEAQGRARYVLAASLARLGRYSEAIREYGRLVESDAPQYLIQGGKEHLALLQERHGDPVQALRTYTELGYDWDVAFMADGELGPRQLSRYIDEYATKKEKPVLIYTLGMRYFRLGDYASAASTFERLSTRQRIRFGLRPKELSDVLRTVTSFDDLPKQRDVLVSVQKLSRLEQRARQSESRLTRAKDLYAMAAYMYRQRSLLYYSPGLWKGSRSFAICLFWSAQVNTKGEDLTLERYCHEHETLNHVIRLCKEVEGLHLRAPVVAQAFYTEGLAQDHLSNLNEYWRNQPRLKERAVAAMRKVVRLYPHSSLAAPAAKYAEVFKDEEQPDYNR